MGREVGRGWKGMRGKRRRLDNSCCQLAAYVIPYGTSAQMDAVETGSVHLQRYFPQQVRASPRLARARAQICSNASRNYSLSANPSAFGTKQIVRNEMTWKGIDFSAFELRDKCSAAELPSLQITTAE